MERRNQLFLFLLLLLMSTVKASASHQDIINSIQNFSTYGMKQFEVPKPAEETQSAAEYVKEDNESQNQEKTPWYFHIVNEIKSSIISYIDLFAKNVLSEPTNDLAFNLPPANPIKKENEVETPPSPSPIEESNAIKKQEQLPTSVEEMNASQAPEGAPQYTEEPFVVTRTHTFSAVLEPLHYTVVYAEITSPVLKIYKRMGESFDEDEVLMELDNRIFEGNYEKAAAAVTKFQTELDAKKQLYADDALSKFELDEGVASLAGAKADFILASRLLAGTKIKAPYKGKVVKTSVKEYELGQQGKELITLVDDDTLYATFLINSSLFNCIEIGMPIDIYVSETGDKIATTLSRIAPVIDPSSSTIMVEAKIDNHEHRWWAGMKGRVDLTECKENKKVNSKR